MKVKKVKSKSAITVFAALALVVICVFVAIDVTVLGRMMFSFKASGEDTEYFDLFDSRTPYTNMIATVPQAEKVRKINGVGSREECTEKCTLDEGCRAYVFDGVKNECQILYSVGGFARSDAMYTTASGVKQRDFIPDKSGKYMRFEEKQLPADSTGKLATYNSVRSIHECKSKCDEQSAEPKKCMVFEYDFEEKKCTLNNAIKGELQPQKSKDVYVAIN